MTDEILLDSNNNSHNENNSSSNFDTIFNSLSNDIVNLNQYINDVNKQKKENTVELKELEEEKARITKSKLEFEEYVKRQQQEHNRRISEFNTYLNLQRQNLLKSEEEFKESMDNSLNEIELAKKELEIEKEKFNQEKEQFDSYKKLELDRIKHSQEILDSDKEQFEKHKKMTKEKIELENKNLEQKCDKIRELISQFNLNFKPIIEENKEV